MKNEERPRALIITGPSGSGKTTVANLLKKELGFSQPIQFTTRKPRNDNELDEYVFLTKDNYFTKLENGDFSNFQSYGNEFYAISSHLPEGNFLVIVDPIGKLQLEKFFKENGVISKSFYIDISEDLMRERLSMKRGETCEVIENRLKDFKYFSSDGFDFVVDGDSHIDTVYEKFSKAIKAYGFR